MAAVVEREAGHRRERAAGRRLEHPDLVGLHHQGLLHHVAHCPADGHEVDAVTEPDVAQVDGAIRESPAPVQISAASPHAPVRSGPRRNGEGTAAAAAGR